MSRTEVVILSGSRTPQGRVNGQLARLSAVQLGASAIAGALEQAGIPATEVDAVLMGQVLQAGAGQNPARQSAINAGIPWSVPAMTLNKVCLSSLAAVIDAAHLIRLGEAHVVVAGGQEPMTQAPHILPGSRHGWAYGSFEAVDHMALDGLTDAFENISMGASTESTIKVGASRARSKTKSQPGRTLAHAPPSKREFSIRRSPASRCRSVRAHRW